MVIGIGTNGKGNIFPLITQEVESAIIRLVLEETNFNYFQTAKLLGISRSTLYRKVHAYKIDNPKKDSLTSVDPLSDDNSSETPSSFS